MKKSVHSLKYINLNSISNDDEEEGFLPTFGPIFVHMYTQNNMEGYAGTILMSIRTELEELILMDNRKSTMVQKILPIDEVL